MDGFFRSSSNGTAKLNYDAGFDKDMRLTKKQEVEDTPQTAGRRRRRKERVRVRERERERGG